MSWNWNECKPLTTGNLNDAVLIRAAGGKMGLMEDGDENLLAMMDNAPEAGAYPLPLLSST